MDAHRKTVLLFMVVAFVMTACPTGVRAACCCPSLWTAFGRNCYRFFSYNLTWQEAENYCKSFSVPSLGDGGEVRDSLGHLVSIHSEAENDFVSTLFRSSYKKQGGPGHFATWIGLHDISTEGLFEWTDGTPVDYQLWRPGEPSGGAQDCGTLSVNFGYKWDDDGCTKTQYDFVCKLPAW